MSANVSAMGASALGQRGPSPGSAMGATNPKLSASSLNTTKRNAASPPLKFDVCVDALMQGCVNAFIDTFTLTHRPPVCVDELAQTMFAIPDDTLGWVQERLVQAELRRRESDFRGVLEEHTQLAQYFESCGDRAQAVKQHQAALQAGVDSMDNALEGEAHENLALLYRRFDMLPEAAVHHEKRFKLATLTGDPDDKKRAAARVVDVTMQRGKQAVTAGAPQEAQAFYEKAVDIARGAGDAEAESEAYAALGDVTVLLGDMRKALEYQQRTLVVSRTAKNNHGESLAALRVAQLQDTLGHTADAVKSLKQSLDVAEDSGDMRAISDATKQLGETYRGAGENVRAVHYLKEHFKVSRDLGEQGIVDDARVQLGFALGEHHFTHAGQDRGFLSVVCDDLGAQLEWMGSGVL